MMTKKEKRRFLPIFNGKWRPPVGEVKRVSPQMKLFAEILKKARDAAMTDEPCPLCEVDDMAGGGEDCLKCPLRGKDCSQEGKVMFRFWEACGYFSPDWDEVFRNASLEKEIVDLSFSWSQGELSGVHKDVEEEITGVWLPNFRLFPPSLTVEVLDVRVTIEGVELLLDVEIKEGEVEVVGWEVIE